MRQIETFAPKELSDKLRVPYRIVLKAIKNGELKTIHFTKKYRRIRSEDAAAWIQRITK